MESNHRGRAYETRLLQGTQRLRRHDLHVRPSAHEADELLLLHSAVRLPGIALELYGVQLGWTEYSESHGAREASSAKRSEPGSRTWQARVLPLNHGRMGSPRPDLHRNRPFTKRLLGYSSCRDTRQQCATCAHRHLAPAEGFEPSSFPVTVGRLTVRPRWNTLPRPCPEQITIGTREMDWENPARPGGPLPHCRLDRNEPGAKGGGE